MFIEPRKIIFRTIGVLVFISILIFIYFKYSRYLTGPEITSINIDSYMVSTEPSTTINAKIHNTKNASINGRDIILENKNSFHEIIVFSPGNNIIEIVLEDSFGKSKSYIYQILLDTVNEIPDVTLEQARANKEVSEITLPIITSNE